MNNLDTTLELVTIAAAKYASDEDTIVEDLVDGIYEDNIIAAMEAGWHNNVVDAMCAVVGDASIIAHKHDIIIDILTYSKWDLLVQVMYREPYQAVIRKVLSRENKYTDVYSMIESKPRFSAVYTDFVKWFAMYSVCSYETGSFAGYIKTAFESFYYKQYKKDIWEMLREVDFAKKEADMKQSFSTKILKSTETSDVYINPLLTNIYLANKLLFQHSGHTLNMIVYDIVHLIINYRIGKYINSINERMTTLSLELLDTGLPLTNGNVPDLGEIPKGAISKISNAMDMIPKLYEYVAEKKLNERFLGDLREMTFTLGKGATSDSNCVWKLEDDTKETQGFLDRGKAISNYANFEILLNGVVSACVLIDCMEDRGMSVVDMYDADFFKDISLIRSIDYLSSLQYKDLIMQLKNTDEVTDSTELLDTFDRLVYRRAGSAENNRIDNKLRREKAYTFGMLKNPALKQKKVNSPFEKLKGIYLQLAAIPKTSDICMAAQKYTTFDPKQVLDIGYARAAVPADILGSVITQDTLTYNLFLQDKPVLAASYFREFKQLDISHIEFFPIVDKEDKQEILLFAGNTFQYNADVEGYIINNQVIRLSDLQEMMSSGETVDFSFVTSYTPKKIPVKLFPALLGLAESNTPKHQQSLNAVYGKHKDTAFGCRAYHDTVFALSCLQDDFLGLISKVKATLTAYIQNDLIDVADKVVQQFLVKEFDSKLFSAFLNDMFFFNGIDTKAYNAENLTADKSLNLFEKLLISAFLFEDYREMADRILQESCESTALRNLYYEFLATVDTKSGPTALFVLMYNYIHLQLHFHLRLRDSFELVFIVQNMEIRSLICELAYRFGTLDWVSKVTEDITFGYAVDSVSNADIIAFIKTMYMRLTIKYKYLLEEFNKYVGGCATMYSTLCNTSAVSTPATRREFKSYGEMFNKTRDKIGIPVLDRLREAYTCDEAGFFMRNGEYLRSYYGNAVYYIHRTGNLLMASGDAYYPIRYSEYTQESKEAEFVTIITNSLSF